MAIGARIVCIPVLVITGNAAVINEAGEDELVCVLRVVVRNPVDVIITAEKPEFIFLRMHNRGGDNRPEKDQTDCDFQSLN